MTSLSCLRVASIALALFVAELTPGCSSDGDKSTDPAAGTTGLGGGTSSGGATAKGGTSSGGSVAAQGGSSNGGSPPGTGGASVTSGGATVASGGASGGAAPNTGGSAGTPGTGGTAGEVSGSGGGPAPSGGTAGASGGGPAVGGNPAVISGGVRWVGRVDIANAAGPRFAWSGTGFVATVEGDTISVKMRSEGGNDPVFFQPVIDGMPGTRVSVSSADGEKVLTLGTGLGAGDHVVALYRETEGKPGYAVSTFLGFASGTAKEPPAYSGRLIEVIGDSISAGYGNLGSEQHPNGGEDPSGGCRFSTETESAYLTYGAVAARALDADASILAASGWGVYSDNGGSTANVLSNVYEHTLAGMASPAWSFSLKPQAVVINLGTNDFSANMSLAQGPFSDAYKKLLTSVRGKYPDALIYCAIGPLLYGTGLSNATAYINAVVADVNAAGDSKVKVLNFGQQNASMGTGCDWHPSAAENKRMADLLVKELQTSLSW